MVNKNPHIADFYLFKIGSMWRFFKGEHLSFWMICGYLFFEFVRPQAIWPALDFLPWAQLFLMGALAGSFIDKSVTWVAAPTNKWVILFTLAICLSVLTAQFPQVSKDTFMNFFSWIIIYFLILNIVNSKERLYLFVLIYLVAAAKIAIGTSKSWALRGFSFTNWGLMGPRGFFQNSGELAILMLMLFPLALYLYQSTKEFTGKWEKALIAVFFICPILTILGASSRGAQIALAIQCLMIFRKNLFRVKSLVIIVVAAVLLFSLLPEEQKQRFTQLGDDKTSQQRILYWGHGWEMMLEYPLTGVGLNNFVPYYDAHFHYDELYAFAELPHNIFIQVGTDAGFPAVLFLMAMIFYCVKPLMFKDKSPEAEKVMSAIQMGMAYGVLGFAIAGQFVTVTYYPFLWIHMAMLAAYEAILKKARKQSKNDHT